MITIPINIWYYKSEICAVSFNDKCIWDSGMNADVINNDGENFMQIDVSLPWMVAVNFVVTICNGVNIQRLKGVLEEVKARTADLITAEQRNLELDTDLNIDW